MLSKYNFSFRGLLAAIFSRHMEFPTDVPGLFTQGETRLDIAAWRRMLLDSDFPPQCVLEQLKFCKAAKRKQHEFIVLYFRHWDASVPATAVVVVDRAPNTFSNDDGYSTPITHSSGVTSPSALQTPALDSVFTTPNIGAAIQKYLRTRYGRYEELCTLKFSTTSARPSATQISVLLFVISQHAPNYHLYQFQCYWFASTIWEAIKRLFPGYLEAAWQSGRSRCHGFKVDKADSVDVVCKEYADEWARLENEAEQKRQVEHARAQQLRMEGLAQGLAMRQAEIDRLLVENAQLRSRLGM
ncbi:hypothetical protein CY34DRAFT_814339 [Suillus luteus UH-Slu-Lm8-n1]|uniref:Uncharacterized protein n=1 Tax=Suillus luteus UH-Slu-Lm8-n1 TaxID=930992 RepID=A0A0C9ZSV0_9AGAM|nr:hypothetical protein CY34DRAFT_814339 [Suillus luteus UH-Slu-Lm8-n1]